MAGLDSQSNEPSSPQERESHLADILWDYVDRLNAGDPIDLEAIRAEHPEFSDSHRPLQMTGEMMYPWMFEEIRSLRPFRAAVEALAARPRHGRLYDPQRLADNEVPVTAAVYFDDMYVDAGLSLETARRVGNLETWVTNEYEHDGVRQSGAVFARLVKMTKERGGPRV